jgi:hypothetical protein
LIMFDTSTPKSGFISPTIKHYQIYKKTTKLKIIKSVTKLDCIQKFIQVY